MHKKHEVIAPLLQNSFGLNTIVPEHLNTDVLGTFSGEIERVLTPIQTALKKCEMAMELCNCDLAIASEGSFGPHPNMPFIAAHHELIVLHDKKNNLIISENIVSLNTNYSGKTIKNKNELNAFLQACEFPSHAVIMSESSEQKTHLKKGIQTKDEVLDYYEFILQKNHSVYIETDMRAMMNPKRMSVIREVCIKLIDKMNSTCPSCGVPGFGITERKSGLLCELCRFPTRGISEVISTCEHCKYQASQFIDILADAGTCDNCNP